MVNASSPERNQPFSVDSAVDAADVPPARERKLAPGTRVGRYLVRGLVGRGAMGEVYRAHDPELGRQVAIKVVRAVAPAGGAAVGERARLMQEARAMARISHRNVIVVHDVGAFEDGVFIAMDFVSGSTVGYWLLSSPRRWQDVLGVFVEAGRGLAAAHDKHVVHHDFKPDNVMIGHDGQVRVTDFGLARELRAGRRETEEMLALGLSVTVPTFDLGRGHARQPTARPPVVGAELLAASHTLALAGPRPGTIRLLAGTPAYMSPEQFLGAQTDERTDQFSFCVALYEAIYGRRPFAGQNVLELRGNVFSGRVGEEPVNSDVPRHIRAALLRGMSPHPEHRFATMHELLATLTAPASAPRVHGRVLLAAGCAALVLATAMVTRVMAFGPSPQGKSAATLDAGTPRR